MDQTRLGDCSPTVGGTDGIEGLRVLYAEDDPGMRRAVGRLLKVSGASVAIARDGLEATLKAQAETFDVVLMDLRMPRMDGIEAALVLRALDCRVPIIGVTADTTAGARAKAIAAGFDVVLPKPFDLNELIDAIQLVRGRLPAQASVESHGWGRRRQPAMKARLVRCSAWFVAALFAPAALAWSQNPPPPPPKRVLMLYGHDTHAPGVVAFIKELHAIVGGDSPPRVVFYDELLDLDRFPENAHRAELVDYIVDKYRGFRFDAILTEGTRALKFATEEVSTHFPGVPIVYGLAFEPEVDFSALPKNVTGRHHLLRFGATLELAHALQPDAERVVLVAGTGRTDSLLLTAAVRELTPLLGGMPLMVWQDWTYASLLQSMRTLPPRTITILSGFSRDRSGQHFNEGDLIASVTRLASAPVYGIARNWVGDGIVGGVTLNFGDDGVRTGRLLLQVLDRTSRGLPLPPPEVGRPEQVVDWRALERWGLSEDRLLPGTEVLFRTPTVWQRFRTLILAIAAILAAQSVLIALLFLERRRRVRAMRMVEESRGQLAHIGRVATLGEMTAAISHELRQPLAAIRAHAQAGGILLDRAPSDLSEAREIFRDIASENVRAVEVLDHIRALARKDGAIDASVDLNRVCEHSMELLMYDAARRGVQLRLSLEPGLPPIIGDAVQLQQVVLNLVLNAMDAVQASPGARGVVLGTSAGSGGEAEIFVRDTGPGLPPEVRLRAFEPFFSTKTQGLGMGLAIVRSIVERHRGRVHAENEITGGAVFRVQLPIAAPATVSSTVPDA